MNITELDSFKLSDAVKFHNRLNPKIWGKDEHLLPEVREKLMAIAADFQEFLGVSDLQVKDITVSGSNAAFSYTPHSDIDLHLVVEFPQQDEIYQELFNAKKYQYNNEHNLAISGIPVELYVQNAAEPPVSQGEYSVMNNDWIQVPRRKRAKIDDTCVRTKVEDLDARIHNAVKSGDAGAMGKLWDKIKHMRQSGLDEHGEFGCENIAFKILRTNGCIKDLRDARTAAQDLEMSIREQNKPKERKVWGFSEDVGSTPDGVSPTTCMFLNEEEPTSEEIVNQFIQHTAERLGIEQMPTIHIHEDPAWSEHHHSFGMFEPETHTLNVSLPNRHLLDVLRTVAHELTHCRQHEIQPLPDNAGLTGSDWENEANATAGIIMRDFADAHPEYFDNAPLKESSGYIPTSAQADDPRFEMALSVDVHPGQTGKEANKMALHTDAQGKPGLLIKTANLRESLEAEFALFEEQDLFEIKMTGKNLAQLAQDIKGVKIGLEFEMIVPNVNNDEDGEMEPDYDQDERVRDIDDACNFFDDGDYNSRNEIRRLREQMESDFFDWQHEKIDEDWHNNGFEFFQEYLDREEPFDPEDYQERAEDEIKAEFPELDPTSEDFGELVAEKLREINAEYYVETWEAQGRSYDYAQEEFSDEKRDEYSESDWLDDRGIRYASDVQNEYSDVQWPYWSSTGDSEGDIESVALDFMNAMGMDSVAISSSYHGSYKKWVGNGWVGIGSSKPDDCFTIEPDGSLEGDDDNDRGLEFVSPPIPLEDIGTVMKKVQAWAGRYGAYTGLDNKTSMHTNISVPGYDLKNLDYLKAALLLGDEHVLREFERFGNTYAAPAIEKIRQLVKHNPDKAKELLDKMKSQLNAEASKLIHSGQTNKFTSINTKDNRIEYRSPGGDYLSDIANNPKKLQDTINRMVVTMDAAMDPDKYKQEYQKKLYKLLTGQESGREGATGAKKEMKASDKDLLNLFSRYAAGELPRQALKSFVRQAQLERKGKSANPQADAQQSQPGNWGLWLGDLDRFARMPNTLIDDNILHRFSTRAAAEQYIERTRAENPRMRTDIEVREIEPAQPIPGSTLDLQRQRATAAQEPQGVDTSVPYEIYNRETGEVVDTAQLRNDDEALVRLSDYRQHGPHRLNYQEAERAFGIRQGAGVRPPTQQSSTLSTNNLTPRGPGPWEVASRSNNQVYFNPNSTNRHTAEAEARAWLMANNHNEADFEVRTREGVRNTDAAQSGIIDIEPDISPYTAPQTLTRPGQGQQMFTGEWKVTLDGEEIYRFGGIGNNQMDANRVGREWARDQIRQGLLYPAGEIEVTPVMS